jgi:hypothetical protein
LGKDQIFGEKFSEFGNPDPEFFQGEGGDSGFHGIYLPVKIFGKSGIVHRKIPFGEKSFGVLGISGDFFGFFSGRGCRGGSVKRGNQSFWFFAEKEFLVDLRGHEEVGPVGIGVEGGRGLVHHACWEE